LKDEVQEVKEEVPEEGGEPKEEAPVEDKPEEAK